MNYRHQIIVRLFGISVLFFISAQSHATNGYFSHGTSVNEKGLAGAGAAYSQDSLAAATNPAGMVWQGNRYDIGAALFAPMRNYTVTGGPALNDGAACGPCPFSIGNGNQNLDSDNELFLIPQFGYNRALDNDRSIGISVFGNGGMNTEYQGGTALLGASLTGPMVELPGTFGSGTAGVDLAQLFISTTYAVKISDSASWGISGILAYQQFEATGLANFGAFSLNPARLSNQGTDSASGIGLRLGFQAEISPGIWFGASYQPEIDMGEFDRYAGLFAENGDFDIPSNYTLGLAWKLAGGNRLVVDLQQINYEDVASVSNPIAPLTNGSCVPGMSGGSGSGCLGGSGGAGFGWENMTVLKLGYEWTGDSDWTWRVGYSKTDQPIPDSENLFNILAPGVIEEHFTFGFARPVDADSSLNFALMLAPSHSVSGANTFDSTQTIVNEMDQYELVLTYSKRL